MRGVLAFAAGVVYNHSRAMNGSDARNVPESECAAVEGASGAGASSRPGAAANPRRFVSESGRKREDNGRTSAFALSRVVPRSNASQQCLRPCKISRGGGFFSYYFQIRLCYLLAPFPRCRPLIPLSVALLRCVSFALASEKNSRRILAHSHQEIVSPRIINHQ